MEVCRDQREACYLIYNREIASELFSRQYDER
jgi:hypothetical protein